jgi:uncharacterized cupin superfamily protein
MDVTRFAEAPEYHAPGHEGMRCLRMLGREAGPSGVAWMGLSIIEPGGCVQPSVSPYEKLYLVIEGELEFSNQEGVVILRPWDACRFAQNERRTIANRSGQRATVLLAMANIILET